MLATLTCSYCGPPVNDPLFSIVYYPLLLAFIVYGILRYRYDFPSYIPNPWYRRPTKIPYDGLLFLSLSILLYLWNTIFLGRALYLDGLAVFSALSFRAWPWFLCHGTMCLSNFIRSSSLDRKLKALRLQLVEGYIRAGHAEGGKLVEAASDHFFGAYIPLDTAVDLLLQNQLEFNFISCNLLAMTYMWWVLACEISHPQYLNKAISLMLCFYLNSTVSL